MFENIIDFFKKLITKDNNEQKSKEQAKERLLLVLRQDRSKVSYEFLDLMKQEIIEVIKKYIEVDDELIDVKLTNELQKDKKTICPTLYANIPIAKIKEFPKKTKKDIKNNSSKEFKEKAAKKNIETKIANQSNKLKSTKNNIKNIKPVTKKINENINTKLKTESKVKKSIETEIANQSNKVKSTKNNIKNIKPITKKSTLNTKLKTESKVKKSIETEIVNQSNKVKSTKNNIKNIKSVTKIIKPQNKKTNKKEE